MSKLLEAVKIFNKIEEVKHLIGLCEMTMSDVEKAKKIYGENAELTGIYNRNKEGKVGFEEELNRLEEEFKGLIPQVKEDPNFAQEIEKADVPSELKKLLGFSEEASSAGYERPEE